MAEAKAGPSGRTHLCKLIEAVTWMSTLKLLFSQAQRTVTQDYVTAWWSCIADEKWRKISIFARTHYRLVLAKVGCPLRDLKNAKELFVAGRDAAQGMYYPFPGG